MTIRAKKQSEETGKMTRIAIINEDKCKPKNCGLACKKACPVVRQGKQCITVETTSKMSTISEVLCIGCGICTKKCPNNAIDIINLPTNLNSETTHRFGENSFKLHRLPTPRTNEVLGLVGTNGIGKTTALKILTGGIKPNLGNFTNPPEWTTILKHFRGSELQNYFSRLLENNLKIVSKLQNVGTIPNGFKGKTVQYLLKKKSDMGNFDQVVDDMDLGGILDRDVDVLSGGELQRFAIAICAVQKADVYVFDEPTSFLDVKQRLKAAKLIRSLRKPTGYVIVVEHDLAILDYLSDSVCCLYGTPGAYGVVTLPSGVREGINHFLDGWIPTENMRFRDTKLSFKVTDQNDKGIIEQHTQYSYPGFSTEIGDFELNVEGGEFTDSQIIVLLGENGTGKSTLIRVLAGNRKLENGPEIPKLNISYKPQHLTGSFQGTVSELFLHKIRNFFLDPTFKSEVLNPLQLEHLYDHKVETLSGGELQRVAIALCLGKPADVYLIDEPSANLDSEQRLHVAKVIKRFILHAKKTAFVVEHDFIMSTYLADKVIVFDGEPSKKTLAKAPESVSSGMNHFLKTLDITFRRDNDTFRPRINKTASVKDIEQKLAGTYFFLQY
ncbi:hypothetical protein L596_013382 [Steinernema carpocapsae]|uniref:ABC transporter domain-containing protein n=1 Tax=Steinernema carpocapsae TaxID=34508 RepID=A0A4U5NZZ8_STECR|nr:hypothetical protein L596_013382 [Steinernema carpocapsae]